MDDCGWLVCVIVSNGMVVQMRVATERAKLVRGITASFKKLSRSSEVSLACHAPPDMTLHCSDQAALFNPKTSVLTQKHHLYTGHLNRETSGDSKNTFLHCGDVLALMPAACSCASLQETLGWARKHLMCARVVAALLCCHPSRPRFTALQCHCFTVCRC